ncbi:MAG: NADH-quinone oxidoreductase subunit NuoE [Anaerolineae bacterium]
MEEIKERIEEVLARYDYEREALVEMLRDLNDEVGYLDRESLGELARHLSLPESEVYGVASFYSMISVEPLGKHVIKLCEDAPCHVAGGREVWETLERELGIRFGETSPDGEWTLLPTSCIGLCAVGPVMTVDGDVYGNLTPEKIPAILERYRAGASVEEAPEPLEEPLGGDA